MNGYSVGCGRFGSILFQLIRPSIGTDALTSLRVDARRGLVHEQDAALAQQRAADANELALPDREIDPALQDGRVELLRQGLHILVQVHPAERLPNLGVRAGVEGVEVEAQGAGEEHGVLCGLIGDLVIRFYVSRQSRIPHPTPQASKSLPPTNLRRSGASGGRPTRCF